MIRTPGPREVVERYLRLVAGQRWADLPALYAEDALVEHPLDPHAALHGRAPLRAHFDRLEALGLQMTATNAVFHEAGDTVITEFTYRGVTGAGDPVARRCVHVTTVRDGLIVTSRDYQAAITP